MLLACLLNYAQAGDTEKTQKFIAILQSNAGLFEKARACQQLGEVGTKEAVPALAALLGDEQLGAYARSGLEGIQDPASAEALRTAAASLKGNQLIGVINSLGVLRDAKAVGILRQFAGDPASGAVKESLLALGRIANEESIQTIRQALANGQEQFRPDAAAACLLAAQIMLTHAQTGQAMALYDAVRVAKVPLSYRVGATRGAILARQANAAPFLIEQLRSEEHAIRNAALLTIREIPSDALASSLNAELARANPELTVLLLTALVDCHNARSISAILRASASNNLQIRNASVAVIGKIGGLEAAQTLLAIARRSANLEEVSIAYDCLKQMQGKDIDKLVFDTLAASTEPGVSVKLIGLVETRGLTNAASELLKLAAAPEPKVSLAALSALAALGGQKDLPALMALMSSCTADAREAVESAIISTCTRNGQTEIVGEAALIQLKQATDSKLKISWIKILTSIGYAKALPVIKEAMTGPDETLAVSTLGQLANWPDPAPMEELLVLVETGANPAHRKIALASAIQLATVAAEEHQRPDAMVVDWLQRADKAAQTVESKRRIISVLGRLKQMDSFRLLVPYLDNTDLQTEAAQAVVQIAPGLVAQDDTGAVADALEKISATIQNQNIRSQAAKIAQSIPKQSRPKSLFDGKTLAGWEGSTNVWRVRDGVIVGGSTNGNPQNEFLATLTPYSNFVLRLEYKLVGTEGFVNSGVQFNSVRVKQPANEMSGYQADIGAGYSGCLYDESRRNKFLVQASADQIKRLEKPGDWNRYEVRCAGPRIQILLNGEKTVDYTETNAAISQAGLIGLQIHGGNKAEVSFRNLTIADLSYNIAARDFGVPKAKWKVVSFSSENTKVEDERAVLAIDDNPNTFWHTIWNGGRPGHPHHLAVDFGEQLELTGFTYLPRQDGRPQAGVIGEYEFYLSQDGQDWGQAVARGRFDRINIEATGRVVFLSQPLRARYLKLVSLSAPDNQPFAGAAEIGVMGRALGK